MTEKLTFLTLLLASIFAVSISAAIIETGDVRDFNGVVTVGVDGEGSWTVDNGSQVTIAGIFIASGINSTGIVAIKDPGTVVNLDGAQNRIGVGEGGLGSMSIEGGAVVDGTANAANCEGSNCNFYVGNAAGSTGNLVVTGTGSTLKTMTTFVIGVAGVFLQDQDGFNFGIPSAETYASFEISDNARVESKGVNISGGPGGGSTNGDEQSYAVVSVSDSSSWTMDQLGISTGPNAHAEVSVTNGSTITINNFLFTGFDASSEPILSISSGGVLEVGTSILSPTSDSKTRVYIDAATFHSNGAILPDYGQLKMDVLNNAEVSANRYLIVSHQTNSNAFIKLGKGAVMEAGDVVALGYNFFGGDPGSCHIIMLPGSVIRSENVVVGPHCRVVGRGRIEGNFFNQGGFVGKGIKIISPEG